jgi:hypothetical protein
MFDDELLKNLGIVIRLPHKKRQPGKHKGGGSSVKARIGRVLNKTPEAMLKITGRCNKGLDHLHAHLNYITRNGEVVADTQDGGVAAGREAVKEVAKTWYAQQGKVRKNSPIAINFILSMPSGTNRDLFNLATRNFADRVFGGLHEYMHTDHRDTAHTHVHLTVRARGNDGQRLNPRKADLAEWREVLAHELRAVGIEAEATPRTARGVVMKAMKQAVRHADDRKTNASRANDGRAGRPNGSTVQRNKVFEAVQEAVHPSAKAPERPWEPKIQTKQAQVRQAWMALATEYESKGGEGIQAAADIRLFVASMPAVETERDVIRRQVQHNIRVNANAHPEAEA